MSDEVEERSLISKRAPAIAAAVVIGFAAFELIRGTVRFLVCPIIAIFIGDSHFELNSLTIQGSELRYGLFLEVLVTFIVAMFLARYFLPEFFGGIRFSRSGGVKGNICPECLSPVQSEAKRCPYCTSSLSSSSIS